MKLLRLATTSDSTFDNVPEIGPALHMTLVDGVPAAVIGGIVVMKFDGTSTLPDVVAPWLKETIDERQRQDLFEGWFGDLRQTQVTTLPYEQQVALLWRLRGFTLNPPGVPGAPPGGPAPPVPPPGYGRLPFTSSTTPTDVFYRHEPFPTSRRIDRATGAILPNTYTSPASEIRFLPTGFSVVARCALPLLFPACVRWQMTPKPVVAMQCGAVIPYFGQSGGGVEVCFHLGAISALPIPLTFILPL